MSNFDLKVNNYSLTELQEIMGVSGDYQLSELEENCSKLIKNIQSDDELSKEVKERTIEFLNKTRDVVATQSMPNLSVVDIKEQPHPSIHIFSTYDESSSQRKTKCDGDNRFAIQRKLLCHSIEQFPRYLADENIRY